jgi:hypothetical protein
MPDLSSYIQLGALAIISLSLIWAWRETTREFNATVREFTATVRDLVNEVSVQGKFATTEHAQIVNVLTGLQRGCELMLTGIGRRAGDQDEPAG